MTAVCLLKSLKSRTWVLHLLMDSFVEFTLKLSSGKQVFPRDKGKETVVTVDLYRSSATFRDTASRTGIQRLAGCNLVVNDNP
jgi:hypothetical protein